MCIFLLYSALMWISGVCISIIIMFRRQLVNDYLSGGPNQAELQSLSCRLLLDVMPGLETTVVFQDNVRPYFFFFRLLPSWVATSDCPSQFSPIFCILLRHFNHCHVISHRIHKRPFWPTPFPLSWQFHPQHPFHNIPIIFPQNFSNPTQSSPEIYAG